jgi:hypothetical protein
MFTLIPKGPGYTGTVKIAGLIDINHKITDIAGNLVLKPPPKGTIEWDTTALVNTK